MPYRSRRGVIVGIERYGKNVKNIHLIATAFDRQEKVRDTLRRLRSSWRASAYLPWLWIGRSPLRGRLCRVDENALPSLRSVAEQVQNIPDDLDDLYITCGSGITASGVIVGIERYGKNVKNIHQQ